jgi:hypothetical protein
VSNSLILLSRNSFAVRNLGKEKRLTFQSGVKFLVAGAGPFG